MRVEIKVSSYFNKYLKSKPEKYYSLPSSIKNLKDLLRYLELPESEVGFTVVNGRRCKDDYVLSEGDIISIYPYIIGG